MKKFLYTVLLFGILALSITSLGETSSQQVLVTADSAFALTETSNGICLLDGTVELSPNISETLRASLNKAVQDVDLNGAECIAPVDARYEENWILISLVGLSDLERDAKWSVKSNAVWSENALVYSNATTLTSAIAGTTEFSQLLALVPTEIISAESKSILDPLVPPLDSVIRNPSNNFRFPLELGTQVYYGSRGVHTGEFQAVLGSGSLSVDLLSDGNSSANHAPNRLYAVEGGTVVRKCSETRNSTYIMIDSGSSKFLYAHIRSSTAPSLGASVTQGAYIGEMVPGDINDGACGYARQGSSWFHVHLEFESTSSLTLSDWTLNTANGIWQRGGETWSINQWKVVGSGSGNGCSAPDLTSPSNGTTLSDRTITFRWNALSGCSFSGYTFRVCTSSNVDNLSNCFIDTGVGETERTETITGRDNQTLYWGVRAANASGGAEWAVRQFRIEPSAGGCSAPSLASPPDGATLSDRTITFRWNTLSGCSFNGYTFRVCTSSNVDNLSNCFIDTGVGGTERTETITGRDNQTLYWGVRAANASGGAAWAVRQFQIDPDSGGGGCVPEAHQIALFEHANYDGDCVIRELGNYHIPSSSGMPNDSVSSIRVGSDTLAVLCKNDKFDGTCETFTASDASLSDNTIGNDSMSSLWVDRASASWTALLYLDKDFGGGGCGFVTDSSRNMCDGYNDAVSSLRLLPGWSVRVWADANFSGATRCLTSSDSDLSNNTFEDGSSMDNKISSFLAYKQSTCPDTAPNQPSSLSVVETTEDSITLSWQDNSNNEIGFHIYRWGYNGTDWEFLYLDSVSANITTFVDTQLTCGTDYFYEISSYRNGSESYHTPWIMASTDSCPVTPTAIVLNRINQETLSPAALIVFALSGLGSMTAGVCLWRRLKN